MDRMTRLAFLAAMILFGSAASTSLRAEDLSEGRCGGDIQPICAVRTVKRCTAWKACNIFQVCCTTWESRQVRDYFRPKGAEEWGDDGWVDDGWVDDDWDDADSHEIN